MIRKYIFWYSFAIVVGFSTGFFIVKGTKISASYIQEYFYEESEVIAEDVEETEEIVSDQDIPVIENQVFGELQNLEGINNNITNIAGKAWGTTLGLTMFRGNTSRTWYGTGPIPNTPETKWKYPKERMCSLSSSGGKSYTWCGSGWTGQPVVWTNTEGVEEVIFGAYDKSVHFVNTQTGKDTKKPFKTGDIIKGSVTLDPDNFPLLYFGSRDNKLRIISLDDGDPKELWSLDANKLGGMWNNDWDGNPVVINDVLYEGGENGWFYAFKLNRRINENDKVEVSPKMIFSMASYNQELINKVGRNVSIENSLAFFGNRVYFANGGGRVLGLDISKIEEGVAPIVFDYWAGDDIDASIVIDDSGSLYISVELERFNERSKEVGQLIKLNPYDTENPYVWGIQIPKGNFSVSGIWATPALYKDYLYVPTHTGRLIGVNKNTGTIVWEEKISPHSWSSPLVIDDKLIIGTCNGYLKNYSLDNPEEPSINWSYLLGGGSCIESTPAIWNGQIFVGTRDGFFYKVDEKQ